MEDFIRTSGVVVAMLVAWLVGPATVMFVLVKRKQQARARRRSPLGILLLRAPGHTLREQLNSAEEEFVWDITSLLALPLGFMAVYFGLAVVGTRLDGFMIGIGVVALVATFAFTTRKLLRARTQVDALKAGLDAEVAVGQQLDRLMRGGAWVFHDVPAETFNIDHVVVAAEGIFAVETKGFTKENVRGRAKARVVFNGETLQFPTWQTSEPLEQAERQAAWLAKWVSSAVAERVEAIPVLALPGWYVDHRGKGTVRVYNGTQLAMLLDDRRSGPLFDEKMIDRIAHQLEQRCRTVTPTYAA